MAGDEQLVRIGGRRLRITNLEKVLYPATGTTKGEVIDYYSRIAELLVPHVVGRPVTRKRWPDGVGTDDDPGMVFFAKDLERGAPSWVRRMPIPHSTGTKEYPLVGDVPTLVYLAQVASLELHVPQWRFALLEQAGGRLDAVGGRGPADRLVLDLDPGPGAGLAECAVVAGWAREILLDMGLEPYPVTSGSKGIHLYTALPPGQSTEQASALANELARAIEADHKDLVVSSMKKAERHGKVLIDWSQNNGSKTTIAPYSLRGRPHPTVAAPRTWDELDDPGLRHLEFTEVLERAETIGDPMAALGFHAGGREAESGPLSAYISKRSADRTPEPVPANPLGASPHGELPRFVIQEHHATALHWDFRLEHDGVLVSWAVPRGVPHSYQRNNLAIMTEDHPMEYATFEGTIPAGEYGGGTVTIWDDGRYELEKWRDDEVIATLEGRPGGPLGRVRLALIRTAGQGEKSSWLLHRMKTDAAGRPQPSGAVVEPSPQADAPRPSGGRAPVRRESASAGDASSGSNKDPEPHRTRQANRTLTGDPREHAQPARASELRPMLATSATPAQARLAARTWADRGEGTDAWVEMKWDGIRAVGAWDGRRLRLFARSGNEVTHRYPELTAVDAGLGAEPCVVDGELVALEPDGRPSFPLLQTRMNLEHAGDIARVARRTPVRYYLFDALSHDGDDLAALTLRERRDVLEAVAAASVEAITVPPVFDDVDAALDTSEQLRLEGIVVKDPASRYLRGGRSESWLKVKNTRTQEVVIAGIRPGKGGRSSTFGSLLLGIPGADGLQYAGRVGSGFSDSTLSMLLKKLTPLRTDRNPLVGVPPLDARDALWVRPELVGEVEYGEFTPGGILRHPRWRGLRPDKSPAEVRRED
ncbi:bifunctional non-homologous end joining protein LigD [Microbacterium sp. BE35]|uniref:ATP-dependent DNA ligase n=1 Tax=Microbacterium sp. BE35 TaxID=2817773 RepID=UPI0028576DD4|nr:ATP-dependent DNA ligase [Microbacterium sp. BE35]MDR7189502.1 bifunctional non-homologous end joining protein LigD [Microbacterium sp. BE35]